MKILGPPTHQSQTLNLDFLVFKSSSNFDIKSIWGKSDGESSLVKFWRCARMSEMIQFFKRCHRKYCNKPPNIFLPLSTSDLWHYAFSVDNASRSQIFHSIDKSLWRKGIISSFQALFIGGPYSYSSNLHIRFHQSTRMIAIFLRKERNLLNNGANKTKTFW